MIGIIGAGLSGLMAGKILKERGVEFEILEASSHVGGRIKTTSQDGFLLDEGFQVLLTSYPQVQTHVDLKALNLRSFTPGVSIYKSPGKSFIVSDPLRSPQHLLSTLLAPIGTLADKIRILMLRTQSQAGEMQALDYLRQQGFSDEMIDSFFRPFFSGVFLEKDLRSHADYFLYLFGRFGQGLASLPAQGMQAFPEQLAKDLLPQIHLGTKVEELKDHASGVDVRLTSGEVQRYRQVILATDGASARRLFPGLGITERKRVVTTVYFSAEKLPENASLLLVNGSGKGRVNHVAFLSAVQKGYAPQGKELVSVNVLDTDEVRPEELLREISSWNLFSTEGWVHLKTCYVTYAQPEDMWFGAKSIRFGKIFLAGDYTQSASIQGAMAAGEKAAREVLARA